MIRFVVVRSPALFALLASAACALGCSSTPAPRTCRGSASCKEGESCVLSGCSSSTTSGAVPATSRRILVEPEAAAFVASEDDDGGTARPPMIALGSSVGVRGRILLKFPRRLWAKEEVLRAFLVLERAEGAQVGPDDVLLRAQRIIEPWSLKGGLGVTWASAPRAEALGEAIVAARGAGPVRIDVTAYAIDLGKKTQSSWGLRVEGKGEGFGVAIATGAAKGNGPRLEVFLQ